MQTINLSINPSLVQWFDQRPRMIPLTGFVVKTNMSGPKNEEI